METNRKSENFFVNLRMISENGSPISPPLVESFSEDDLAENVDTSGDLLLACLQEFVEFGTRLGEIDSATQAERESVKRIKGQIVDLKREMEIEAELNNRVGNLFRPQNVSHDEDLLPNPRGETDIRDQERTGPEDTLEVVQLQSQDEEVQTDQNVLEENDEAQAGWITQKGRSKRHKKTRRGRQNQRGGHRQGLQDAEGGHQVHRRPGKGPQAEARRHVQEVGESSGLLPIRDEIHGGVQEVSGTLRVRPPGPPHRQTQSHEDQRDGRGADSHKVQPPGRGEDSLLRHQGPEKQDDRDVETGHPEIECDFKFIS